MKIKSVTRMAAVNGKNYWHSRGKEKIFCIGRNKTGTTSLAFALRELGYIVGHQPTAEHLADRYYFAGNFRPIVQYCQCGQVFQDVPFSWPETYKYMDRAYPGSKFILTVRDDSEQWYRSITRFHAKRFGKNEAMPTACDLKMATYRRKGFLYNTIKVHGTSDTDPYNSETLKAHYDRHNEDVISHFRERPKQLLVLNLADKNAYRRFIDFLGVSSARVDFPWENRT